MPDIIKVLLNSIFSFVYLFIVAKLLGKKQVAQLTVVDYVVGISIGSIAAEWCTDATTPWYFYAIGMGVFFLFSVIIDFFERKTTFLKNALKGKELEIITDGKINYKNLKKSKLAVNDLLGMCRAKNYFDLNAIAYVYFETNGEISILPKGHERPTKAEDFKNLKIEKASPSSYIIIDGKINYNELNQLNKNKDWLYKKCNIKSKQDLKNIILAEYIQDINSFNIHTKK